MLKMCDIFFFSPPIKRLHLIILLLVVYFYFFLLIAAEVLKLNGFLILILVAHRFGTMQRNKSELNWLNENPIKLISLEPDKDVFRYRRKLEGCLSSEKCRIIRAKGFGRPGGSQVKDPVDLLIAAARYSAHLFLESAQVLIFVPLIP